MKYDAIAVLNFFIIPNSLQERVKRSLLYGIYRSNPVLRFACVYSRIMSDAY